MLKRHHKNIDFNEDSSDQAGAVQITYDTVAAKMLSKEHTDPIFYPLDIINNKETHYNITKEDEKRIVYQGKKMIIDELKKTMVKPRSDKVIRQQNLLVNTEKEVLKYEYFQKIKYGQEEEHLVYLMSNLKRAENKTPEDERNKKRHERNTKEFDDYNEKIIGTVKKTQDLLTHNKLEDVYKEICLTSNKADKLLTNYADAYKKMKKQRDKDNKNGKFDFMQSPEKYKTKIQQDFKISVQKRNWRLKKANKLKKDLVVRRKKEIEDGIEKKSVVYREKQEQKDVKTRETHKKMRKFMLLFDLELVIRLIHRITSESNYSGSS